MDGQCNVMSERAHFDGEHAFGDQFAGAYADDPNTQHALGLRIEDQLGHAFGAVESHGAAGGSPGKLGHFDLAIFFLRLGFGQAAPGDFRIGEDDGGDSVGLEGDFVSGDGFDGGASFVRGFVGEHGFADYIADGVDSGVVGLQLFVYLDESALADFDLSLFQAGDFGVGLASDRNQNFVEELFAFFYFGAVEGDADSVGFFFHGGDGRVEQDGIENLFHALMQGKNEIAICSGQEAGEHLDDRDLRA